MFRATFQTCWPDLRVALTLPPLESYSPGMTVKVGEKGQVVIPKAIREAAGLHPGDSVDVEFRDGKVVLARSERGTRPLGGRYAGSGIDSAALLLEDRRHEPR